MDTTQPSQPFDKTDYTALYIHYQERGAEIKGQMISTLTLLYAVLATLVGFLWSGGDNALVGSWVGLALSTFSLYLVSDFRKHMNRNYTLSKAVMAPPGVDRLALAQLLLRGRLGEVPSRW